MCFKALLLQTIVQLSFCLQVFLQKMYIFLFSPKSYTSNILKLRVSSASNAWHRSPWPFMAATISGVSPSTLHSKVTERSLAFTAVDSLLFVWRYPPHFGTPQTTHFGTPPTIYTPPTLWELTLGPIKRLTLGPHHIKQHL